MYYLFGKNVFQSCLPHTDCEDGEIVCPLGRIGSSERIDTFGRSRRCINESFVCDGLLDCVGGTDEVDCGPSKILHCHESNYCYVWKAVGDVFVAVRVEIDRDSVMYFDHITAFETL